jgi:hypothetical protein
MFDDKVTKHESFGAITANRVSGQTYLFGSEALHNGFIRIEISTADLRRSLNEDRHYADRRLVTIDMTYEQWARFVSSFGIGMGTPCTLVQITNKQYEKCPEPEHFASKFQTDLRRTMAEATQHLEGLIAKLKESNLPGNKPLGKTEQKVVLHDIEMALMQIKSNIPFLEQQFDEHMEHKVAAALVEIEGVVSHGLRQAGLEKLREGMPDYNHALSMNTAAVPQLPEVVDAEMLCPDCYQPLVQGRCATCSDRE